MSKDIELSQIQKKLGTKFIPIMTFKNTDIDKARVGNKTCTGIFWGDIKVHVTFAEWAKEKDHYREQLFDPSFLIK